jgi:hypothetical protein
MCSDSAADSGAEDLIWVRVASSLLAAVVLPIEKATRCRKFQSKLSTMEAASPNLTEHQGGSGERFGLGLGVSS